MKAISSKALSDGQGVTGIIYKKDEEDSNQEHILLVFHPKHMSQPVAMTEGTKIQPFEGEITSAFRGTFGIGRHVSDRPWFKLKDVHFHSRDSKVGDSSFSLAQIEQIVVEEIQKRMNSP